MAYDAFISYSHAADGQLAPALQRGLQRLAKPWNHRRALHVFRDETGLSINPHLWSSIESALDDSDWFIVLASPEAASSEWVNKEIAHWLAIKDADHLLPVVTDGSWTWDPASRDFTAASTAVPLALRGAFADEPRHLDLRWARSEIDLDLRNSRFRAAVADLAAPLHGIAKDELEGEDIRQQRRTRRLARGGVSILALLLVVAIAASGLALSNAQRARRQATVADGRRLGLVSQDLSRQRQPAEALLTAVEAWKRDQSLNTQAALITALNETTYVSRLAAVTDGPLAFDLNADASVAFVVDPEGMGRLWRTENWKPLGAPFFTGTREEGSVTFEVDLDATGRFAAVSAGRGIYVVDARERRRVAGPLAGSDPALSPQGDFLVTRGIAGVAPTEVKSLAGRTTISLPNAEFVGFPPDGRHAMFSAAMLGISSFELGSGRLAGSISWEQLGLNSDGGRGVLSPDGRWLAIQANGVKIVDAVLGTVVSQTAFPQAGSVLPDVLRFSPDGTTMLVTGSESVAESERGLAQHRVLTVPELVEKRRVKQADLPLLDYPLKLRCLDPKCRRLLGTAASGAVEYDLDRPVPAGAAVVLDGAISDALALPGTNQFAVVTNPDTAPDAPGEVRLLGPDLTEAEPAIRLQFRPDSLAISWDATTVVAAGRGTVAVIDARNWRERRTFSADMGGALSFDGRLLATPSGHVYDTGTGRERAKWPAGATDTLGDPNFDRTKGLVWSPSGDRIYTFVGNGGPLVALNPMTGERIDELRLKGAQSILTLTLDPVEKQLIAMTADTVVVVDMGSFNEVGRFTAARPSQRGSLSIGGRFVAASGLAGATQVWDRKSRRPNGPPLELPNASDLNVGILALLLPSEPALVVAPTNLSGAAGGTVAGLLVRWDFDPDRMVGAACRVAGRNLTRSEWREHLGNGAYRKTCPQWPAGD